MADAVHTVVGEQSRTEVGRVLPHEHVVFGPENAPNWSGDYDKKAVIADAVTDLSDCLERHNLTVMVDLTAIQASRDIDLLRSISEQSGVGIVAATGFWEGVSYQEWAKQSDIDSLARRFVEELTEGIEGTSICAGVIKVATGTGAIQQHEANGLRAAVRAQRETGAPILTHTGVGSMALEQVAILEQEGADPEHVAIGHLDSTPNAPVIHTILEKGFRVGFDRLGRGRPFQPEDDEKADAIASLARAGFAGQILLAHDASKWFTMVEEKPNRPPWSYLFDTFLPMLSGRGVPDADLEAMISTNPANVLSW